MDIKYKVEYLDNAFGSEPPWHLAKVAVLTTSKLTAATHYRRLHKKYNHLNAWSGHVRIVGDDGWRYDWVAPEYGSRATIQKSYHMDDYG